MAGGAINQLQKVIADCVQPPLGFLYMNHPEAVSPAALLSWLLATYTLQQPQTILGSFGSYTLSPPRLVLPEARHSGPAGG